MRITAIVGSYHKGGMVDAAVDEILGAAREQGARVEKIDLADRNVAFCTNCQACVQDPGAGRGACTIEDDVAGILDCIEASDAIVLASPINFGTVTALMKRFIERLICYGHWPWASNAPKNRIRNGTKQAIVVVSCAAPAILGRWFTHTAKLLKQVARLLGARQVDTLFIGLSRHTPTSSLHDKWRAKARRMGSRLMAADGHG